MEDAPPVMPQLRVRQFFPGLTLRVAHDFTDSFGRAVCEGSLLKLLACHFEGDDYVLACLDGDVRLSASDTAHAAILENAGNACFQPVLSQDCLEELLESIEPGLLEAEDEDEEEDEVRTERIATLREDLDACREWIADEGERGPAPRCKSGKLAAKVFGSEHDLANWIPWLYAAVERL